MPELAPIDNIVIAKVGTSVLADTFEDGRQQLNPDAFARIGRSILNLEQSGTRVVLVTSAAITAGMAEVGLTRRPGRNNSIPELQRLSSIGWRPLLNAWSAALPGRITGSLLLTRRELDLLLPERSEALQTTYTLLSHGETPIANENDSITHTEIAFGDNDTLAATLAVHMGNSTLFGSDVQLVLLSDVHGVYEDRDDPDSVIPTIDNINGSWHLAGGSGSENGTGGMRTKFSAAELVVRAGLKMWIAHGRTEGAIERALSGEIGTEFRPKPPKV